MCLPTNGSLCWLRNLGSVFTEPLQSNGRLALASIFRLSGVIWPVSYLSQHSAVQRPQSVFLAEIERLYWLRTPLNWNMWTDVQSTALYVHSKWYYRRNKMFGVERGCSHVTLGLQKWVQSSGNRVNLGLLGQTVLFPVVGYTNLLNVVSGWLELCFVFRSSELRFLDRRSVLTDVVLVFLASRLMRRQ
jgi:hypothetical protein